MVNRKIITFVTNIDVMFMAEQKKRENIGEYLIYMYQVEDLIRANGFDPMRIEQTIKHKSTNTDDFA